MNRTSLLEGNIRKQLILLALPLLAGNILQQLYNTADSLIVQRFLGTTAFASTGVSGTVMNLFIFVVSGYCTGCCVAFGQHYGAQEPDELRNSVFTSLWTGFAVTLVLSLGGIALIRPLLRVMNTPEAVAACCVPYLRIVLAGLAATFLYNLAASLLRAMGNTAAAQVFLLISVVANILLDLWMVGPLSLGIAGAAWATVIAQGLSAVLCIAYLAVKYPESIPCRGNMRWRSRTVRQIMQLGATSALHQSTLYIGKILVQGAVNTLGTDGIAAFTAASRVEGFANSFSGSGSQAESIHIAQNTGAKNKERVQSCFRHTLTLMLPLGLVCALIMFVGARGLVSVFLSAGEENALLSGTSYLKVIAFFYLLCFTGDTFVGYFRGKGRVLIPFAGTAMHLTLRVILSYLLCGKLGLSAVAWATGAGWMLVVSWQTLVYRRQHKAEQPAD